MREFMPNDWSSPQLLIGLYPGWWARSQEERPANCVPVGYPLWDQNPDDDLAPEVTEFLEEGEPPVVFAPGVIRPQARLFFRLQIRFARESNSGQSLSLNTRKSSP